MPLIIPSNTISALGYEVDNSLRFDDGSSDSLTRTFGSGGNRDKWTLSMWLKKSENAVSNQTVTNISGGAGHAIQFQSDDTLRWFESGGSTSFLATTQVFRDPSAWYHFVFVWDSGNATSSNRAKIYLNGEQITDFGTTTYPSLNADSTWNANANTHYIGDASASYVGFSGYMAEVVFINDQALDPTSFGEFDEDSGIWKPIDVSGLTFGTNGFYLPFENSAALGQDDSGNGNNFTVNNLTSIDQTTDTPTNNFATWNGLIKSDVTLSEGNLEMTGGAISYDGTVGTIVPNQGKWYAEIKAVDATTIQIGFITIDSFIDGARALYSSSSNIYWQTNNTTISYYLNSVYQGDATVTGGTNSVPTYTNNDIIMLAMDLDNGYGWFGKNGTWQNSGDPAAGTNAFNLASDYANGTTIYAGLNNAELQANFGNPPFTISSGNSDADGYGNFEYAVPSGYYALCTKNLAEYG